MENKESLEDKASFVGDVVFIISIVIAFVVFLGGFFVVAVLDLAPIYLVCTAFLGPIAIVVVGAIIGKAVESSFLKHKGLYPSPSPEGIIHLSASRLGAGCQYCHSTKITADRERCANCGAPWEKILIPDKSIEPPEFERYKGLP